MKTEQKKLKTLSVKKAAELLREAFPPLTEAEEKECRSDWEEIDNWLKDRVKKMVRGEDEN